MKMFMMNTGAGDDFMISNNPDNYIVIKFSKNDGTTKSCHAVIDGNDNGTGGKAFCVYQYVVETDNYFDGSAYLITNISIPENIVFNNAGNGNNSFENVHFSINGSFWSQNNGDENKDKIYIDSVAPKITRAWIDMENQYGYKQADGNFYLKKGSRIRVGIVFNEDVYDKTGNDYMSTGNPQNYINILFKNKNGGVKSCHAVIEGNSDPTMGKKYCVYQYVVEEDDYFDGNAYIDKGISIPANTVYDKVGNSNVMDIHKLDRGGLLWNDNYDVDNNKIYIDTVKPNASDAWIDIDSNYGYKKINDKFYLKKDNRIRIGVTFTEDVYEQGKGRK